MAIYRINNWKIRICNAFLLSNLVTHAHSQTVTVNAGASSIPQPYPNAYNWPIQNQTWRNQHNETWHNSSMPNSLWSNATDSNGNFEAAYSPGRAPAIPLAVRSPYTSAWASTANNGSLNSQEPIFWDGSDLGWEGIVTVDGISYEWMGIAAMQLPQTPNFVPAVPISTTYDSSYSNFTFAAGAIQLTASFFSPVTPGDYCRTSIPLSYLTVNVQVMDGGTHNVSLYTDVDGYWVTQPPAPLTWDIYESSQPVNATNYTQSSTSLLTWIVQLQTQYEFGEQNGQSDPYTGQGVFPFWGNFTWTTSQGPAQSLSFGSGYSINQRWKYVNGEGLGNVVDMKYRAADQQSPVYGFEHDLGEVGPAGIGNVTFTIGNVQTPLIRFLSTIGIESLQPWWTKCYGSDLFNLINVHWHDLSNAQGLAAQFEAKLQNDINEYYNLNAANGSAGQYGSNAPPPYWFNGTSGMEVDGVDQFGQQFMFDSGDGYGYLEPPNGCDDDGIAIPNVDEARSYYAFTALAARQVMGACVLTLPSVTATDTSTPYAFMKEISSSGNVNTVDVIFPSMPFWLWAWPEFLEMLLTPLFYNQEHNFYPNQYSMHDLGSHFPNATGHVEGNDEYMPVEESGNMIIMSYAVAKITGSASYISQHFAILQQWATYVIEYSLIPASQLSTDDFAGLLANQTNLAIKGIVALDAMGQISSLVGNSTAAQNYTDTALSYYDQWTQYAIDPSGKHTMLAYQWRSSWGLLYNTYPAKLLSLSVIPDSLWEMQSAWYPTVSQLWGVPLDNRHYWTKSDWEMWTAATCEDSTRRLFVDSLAYWLNTTSSAKPMSDLFQTVHTGEEPTTDGYDIQFNARPVVGGLYSLLALVAAGTAGG